MKGFMSYLKNSDSKMYAQLSKFKPGSTAFNNVWKKIAGSQGERFNEVQHEFIKATHYSPAATSIKNTIGLDVNKYSPALQDVLWSTSVQHGPAGAQKIFKAAGIKPGMSEKEIINRIYNERGANGGMKYFSSSSSGVRNSVVNRFTKERQDALGMLNKYLG